MKTKRAGASIGFVLYIIAWIIPLLACFGAIIRIVQDFQLASALQIWCVLFFAFLLAPITVAVGPWFVLIKFGDWLPFLLVYGSGTLGIIIGGIAIRLARSEK